MPATAKRTSSFLHFSKKPTPLKIILATSEVVPFAKTGGLADVCGALPIELSRLGHEVVVIAPAYRQIHQSGQPLQETGLKLDIPIGNKIVTGSLLESYLPDSRISVYLVQQDDYFDRAQLYREQEKDYKDNCERFVFFSRAVLESIRLLPLEPDILHVHDWQTGLIPAYLKTEYQATPQFKDVATVLTIHNLAYQGQFWHWDMLLTGLDWKYFNWHQMEFFGHLNLMKTGIVFADSINTVSPRYAREIQQHPLGCGLEGILQQRGDVLSGILNGVDYNVWNPQTDQHLAANYNAANWRQGKAACKAALQNEMGLPAETDVPLIGIVGRLADQKGFDLIAATIGQWTQADSAQWAVLGTGEEKYHRLLLALAEQHPDKFAVRLEFSDQLAHRIEAGADIFLMPSRYEPCGLNQLYSLKYGAVPVVHETGGLADTIIDATQQNLQAGTANGFSFADYSPAALDEALRRACQARRQSDVWDQLVTTGMGQDWSWANSARQYVQLYQNTLSRRQQAVLA